MTGNRRGLYVAAALGLLAGAARGGAGEREQFDRDDPRGRAEARRVTEGIRAPEDQLEILRIAEEEAVRWGLKRTPGLLAPVRQAGSAWINLGPNAADFSKNGSLVLAKVDSGRARRILVHPTDRNIVYMAFSGGGVWKTFEAKKTITSTDGPRWIPITESVGSLAIGSIGMNPLAPDSLLLGLGDPFDVHFPGLLHSEDGGATWSSAIALSGQYPGSTTTYTATSVKDIAFDPTGTGGIVLVATDVGLFRAGNFGQGSASSWTLVDLDSAGSHVLQDVWSLAYVGGGTWLAASVDDNGAGQLFRSTDNGVSWTKKTSALAGGTDLGRATLAATGKDTSAASARVYLLGANANQDKQKDVWRSDDGGATWSSLGAFAGSGKAPTNPTTTDSTQTDLDVMHNQANYNHSIVVDPDDKDTVFIGGNLSMLRSKDGGSTWSVMANWLPSAYGMSNNMYVHADWHAATIIKDGGTAVFYGGTDGGLFRSTDLVTAPVPSGNNVSAQVTWEDRLNRGIVSHMMYTVASGAERGSPAGSTCTVDATSKELIYGGLQDNGTRLRGGFGGASGASSSPTTFNAVQGGDGFGVGVGCAPGSSAMGSLLLSTYVTSLRASTDGGANFSPSLQDSIFGVNLHPSYNFVMVVATDHADPAGRTFLVPITDASSREGYVLLTNDGAASWTSTVGGTSSANFKTVYGNSFNAPNGSFLAPTFDVSADGKARGHYVASTRAVGSFNHSASPWVTLDGHAVDGTGASTATWYQVPRIDLGTSECISSGALASYLVPKSVALDPADATGNTLWVAVKDTRPRVTPSDNGGANTNANLLCNKLIGSNRGHVFRTGNALASAKVTGTTTWTAQGADGSGLPNVPVNVIKVDPNDPNTVYAGTEVGLYRGTFNGTSTTWTRYGTGLPLVSVTDLALAADGSSVRIATYGRGFWEIQPKAGGSVAGVPGSGDFDQNQQIDAFDLVHEASLLLTTSADADYDGVGNLAGTVNAIDAADLTALVAKLGGRP